MRPPDMLPSSFLVLYLASVANSLVLHPVLNAHILDNTTNSVNEHTSVCACRSLCMAVPDCTAVSVTRLTPEKVSCAFAKDTIVSGLMEASSKSVSTYVKGVPCLPPFTHHVDVGCYFLSPEEVNYSTATTSCPPGSALANPGSDYLFLVMMDHLATLGATSSGFWLGLNRATISSAWLWSDGRALSDHLWGGVNPNDIGTKCVVAYKNLDFYLNDVACTSTYDFVCIKS